MATKVLIFDIGGTVFDWNTALLEALAIAFPEPGPAEFNRRAFALDCRAHFLDLTAAVVRGELPWMTADQIFAASLRQQLIDYNLPEPGADGVGRLPTRGEQYRLLCWALGRALRRCGSTTSSPRSPC